MTHSHILCLVTILCLATPGSAAPALAAGTGDDTDGRILLPN